MRGRLQNVSFRTALVVVTALAAALRAALLASKWRRPLVPPLNDSLYYSIQATDLAHGHWFRAPLPGLSPAEHGPLTAVVLAPFSWMADPVPWQRLATALCGVATVVVIGLAGRRLGGRATGLAAAAIAAVYPNLWISDGLVMSESVSCLVVSIAVLQLLRWLDSGRAGALVWCAVAFGLGALARSEVVLCIPMVVVLVWLLARRAGRVPWDRLALFVAVAAAVMAPWIAFNLARFDRPVLLTTNESQVLVGANCPETYYDEVGGWSLFCVIPPLGPVVDPGADASVRSAAQRRQAFAYAGDHLQRLPVVALARVGRTLDVYALGNMVHGDVGEERPRWAAWAGVAAFWVLAPVAAWGMVLARRRDRAVLLIPCLAVLVTTIAFYGAHRIRSTAEPALVLAAAIAVVHGYRRVVGGDLDAAT